MRLDGPKSSAPTDSSRKLAPGEPMSAETPTPQEPHRQEIYSQRLKVIWPTALIAVSLLLFLLITWPRHGGKPSARGNRSSSSQESPVGGSGGYRNTRVTSEPHGDGSPVGGPREEHAGARRAGSRSGASGGAGFEGDTTPRPLDDAWWAPSSTPTAKTPGAAAAQPPKFSSSAAAGVAEAKTDGGDGRKSAPTARAKPPESSDNWWHK